MSAVLDFANRQRELVVNPQTRRFAIVDRTNPEDDRRVDDVRGDTAAELLSATGDWERLRAAYARMYRATNLSCNGGTFYDTPKFPETQTALDAVMADIDAILRRSEGQEDPGAVDELAA